MKKGLAAEFRRRKVDSGARKATDKKIGAVTAYGVSRMTAEERRGIADWLRKQAAFVESDGEWFAPIYTARYFAR